MSNQLNKIPNEPDNFSIEDLRSHVINGQTLSEKWRRLQLKRFEQLLDEHEQEIINALNLDLGKPATEAFFEIIAVRQELKLAEASLKDWLQPKRVKVPLTFQPGSAQIRNEPLGCILIIGPWNYPFSLTLQPLISALAAGNTAVIKPSEHSLHTSQLISKVINRHFPSNIVKVFEGDGAVAKQLTAKPFDHIFFTGGERIGKEVMKSAAQNLTPITLELGGKSPAIILEGADLEITAKRLMWGKGVNAGQTCIAPDHLLIKENLLPSLIPLMKKSIYSFYGDDPLKSNDLARIVNPQQFNRLRTLIQEAKEKKQIIFGGDIDETNYKISPTVLKINSRQDPIMDEEIFGPIIPILKFNNLTKTLTEIRKQPKPLALYVFGGSSEEQEEIVNKTSSGGVCINDVIMQAGIPNLPFGGVGASGLGRYHGYSGFQTFSNQKSIFKKPFWPDIKFRYPPYKLEVSWLKKLF